MTLHDLGIISVGETITGWH